MALDEQAKSQAADVAMLRGLLTNKGQLARHFADLFKNEPEGFRGWAQDVAQALDVELVRAPKPDEKLDVSELDAIVGRTPPAQADPQPATPIGPPPAHVDQYFRQVAFEVASAVLAQALQSQPPPFPQNTPPQLLPHPGRTPGPVAAQVYQPPGGRPFAPYTWHRPW